VKRQVVGIDLRYRIKRLEVFGSAARAFDFNPASSDLIFWWSLHPTHNQGWKPFSVPKLIWNSCWAVVLIW